MLCPAMGIDALLHARLCLMRLLPNIYSLVVCLMRSVLVSRTKDPDISAYRLGAWVLWHLSRSHSYDTWAAPLGAMTLEPLPSIEPLSWRSPLKCHSIALFSSLSPSVYLHLSPSVRETRDNRECIGVHTCVGGIEGGPWGTGANISPDLRACVCASERACRGGEMEEMAYMSASCWSVCPRIHTTTHTSTHTPAYT